MSGERPITEPGVEREIDLTRFRQAVVARWWIPAIGVVLGIVLGGIYSLGGGTQYKATALIAPGQAFSPGGGTPVLTYLTSGFAVKQIVDSPQSIEIAAAKAKMSVGELEGHVKVGSSVARLIQVSVQLNRPKRAEDAANAFADIIQKETTLGYVTQSISIYKIKLANFAARLKTLQKRIEILNESLIQAKDQPALDRLVLVSELDAAQATQGATLANQQLAQQQLALAETVERTQLVQPALAEKVPATSHRNAVLDGALIGFILGVVVATLLELVPSLRTRFRRGSSRQ